MDSVCRNVELKARLVSRSAARQVATSLATQRLPDQRQRDTYFKCSQGRLKLREIAGESDELIAYVRADIAGMKTSYYRRTPVSDAATLREMLDSTLGVQVVVSKHREIYFFENVRIHLDLVERLGAFLEFESVLDVKQPEADGYRQLQSLLRRFALGNDDLIAGSYCDLSMAPHGGPAASKSAQGG